MCAFHRSLASSVIPEYFAVLAVKGAKLNFPWVRPMNYLGHKFIQIRIKSSKIAKQRERGNSETSIERE
jgi:hypothetical protein